MPTYVVRSGDSLNVAVPHTPSKRRAADASIESEHDYLEFTPLGAGCEVGRSCHILKFKGKTIMLVNRQSNSAKPRVPDADFHLTNIICAHASLCLSPFIFV